VKERAKAFAHDKEKGVIKQGKWSTEKGRKIPAARLPAGSVWPKRGRVLFGKVWGKGRKKTGYEEWGSM